MVTASWNGENLAFAIRCFSLIVLCTTWLPTHSSCPSDNTVILTIPDNLPPLTGPQPRMTCNPPGIDAATVTQDGNTYFFKGDYYWLVPRSGTVWPKYPRPISVDWGGLPGNLDTALTLEDGRTFFFKGSRYWLFYNQTMMPGYPQPIKDGFCGIPNNLDAAFVWSINGGVYFFKGTNYWRFDGGEKHTPINSKYPLNMTTQWPGMPAPVDTILRWVNGRTYFFKGNQYWRYDDFGPMVHPGRPYPRNYGKEWGGSCFDLKARVQH